MLNKEQVVLEPALEFRNNKVHWKDSLSGVDKEIHMRCRKLLHNNWEWKLAGNSRAAIDKDMGTKNSKMTKLKC